MTASVRYWLDRADRIVEVNDAWDEFARSNDTPGLASPHVVGLWIWDAIDDATTKQLYEAMLRRVRLGRAIEYAFRCDSPALRRRMRMTVALEGGRVRFDSRIVSVEPRPPHPIWSATAARDSGLLRVCGWCKRIMVDGAWLEAEEGIAALGLFDAPALPTLTHGMCADCVERMTALVDR